MTADPGSEAGAAGISAEERVKAATFWAEWDSEREGGDVILASLAVEIAEAHALAATARAEKAEKEVARLRAAISETVGNFDAMECLAGRCTDPPCLWDPIRAALAEPARREGET
jgi:hypothetical protein